MNKLFIKKVLLILCFGIFAQNCCYAYQNSQTTKKINVRVSKNSYTEFSGSLKIEKNHAEDVKLKNIYADGFNLKNKKYMATDVITPPEKKKEKIISEKSRNFKDKNNYLQPQNNTNIYDVSLASGKVSPKVNLAKPSHSQITSATAKNSEIQSMIDNSKNYIAQKEYTRAENLIDTAVEREDKNEWLLAELASLYEQINNLNKASSTYEKAIALNPKRIEIVYSYALCLYKKNNLDIAKTNLEKVIGINPGFMLAYFNLGSIYFQKSDYTNALTSFVQSLKLNPLNADALYNTALTLETMNHKELAYKYYKKCLDLSPNDFQASKAVERLSRG